MEVLYSMLEGMKNCAGHNSFILEENINQQDFVLEWFSKVYLTK